MDTARTIASIGTLIGDPTRAIILASLLDGRAWTAGELARASGVTPQTVSSHLRMLVDAHLLSKDSQGRHRYFRLASQEIANTLEGLTLLASYRNEKRISRPVVEESIRHARTCYDHLAGHWGVLVTEAMVEQRYLQVEEKGFGVTQSGDRFFRELGIDCDAARRQRRKFAHKCLDWSERQYHLAGALGAELYSTFRERKWVRSQPDTRAVEITPAGKRQLKRILGVEART